MNTAERGYHLDSFDLAPTTTIELTLQIEHFELSIAKPPDNSKSMSEPLEGTDPVEEAEPEHAGFNNYRSLAKPKIRIIVARDVVPPFRFKAGGWELLQSSTEPGSAIKARIAENGFFLFHINEDDTGGTELSDIP
jgi:hypothetical protein